VPGRVSERQAGLYRVEHETLDGRGRRWGRVPEAQRYLDELVSSAWFFDRWPHFVRVRVERRGRGASWSTCEFLDAGGPGGRPTEGVVLVAPAGLTEPVVLHELAHLLSPGVGHDVAFAETFLSLVRHQMGFFAFAELFQGLRRLDGFRTLREGIGG